MIESILVSVVVLIVLAVITIVLFTAEHIMKQMPCSYKRTGCPFYDNDLGMAHIRCNACPYWEGKSRE